MYNDCCCFTTPSLAQEYHTAGHEQTLLDIDTRFEYLPKFENLTLLTHIVPVVQETFKY